MREPCVDEGCVCKPLWRRIANRVRESIGAVDRALHPKTTDAGDPVHFASWGEDNRGRGWYFADEVWCDRYGPFPNRGAAYAALEDYAKTL